MGGDRRVLSSQLQDRDLGLRDGLRPVDDSPASQAVWLVEEGDRYLAAAVPVAKLEMVG